MVTIAHEIAHFILGHYNFQYYSRDAEEGAENLTKKWGFRPTPHFYGYKQDSYMNLLIRSLFMEMFQLFYKIYIKGDYA